MKKRFSVQRLAILGVLIAMEVILSRFVSISTWNMKIGFAFIPVAAAAILLGPVEAAVCGGLAEERISPDSRRQPRSPGSCLACSSGKNRRRSASCPRC